MQHRYQRPAVCVLVKISSVLRSCISHLCTRSKPKLSNGTVCPMFGLTYLDSGVELGESSLDGGNGALDDGELTLLDGGGEGGADEGEEESLGQLHFGNKSLARVICCGIKG